MLMEENYLMTINYKLKLNLDLNSLEDLQLAKFSISDLKFNNKQTN
jgi:hypothetical protein